MIGWTFYYANKNNRIYVPANFPPDITNIDETCILDDLYANHLIDLFPIHTPGLELNLTQWSLDGKDGFYYFKNNIHSKDYVILNSMKDIIEYILKHYGDYNGENRNS